MKVRALVIASALIVGSSAVSIVAAPPQAGGRGGGRGGAQVPAGPPPTAQEIAPIDLTGTWVSIVDEDWRWRMMTAPKGDFASLPLNPEGRRVGNLWDQAKDDGAGETCKAFGAGGIMRMPTRIRISWQDPQTLKLEFDAGTQTRIVRFDPKAQAPAERSWQGQSLAVWEGGGLMPALDRNGIPNGPSPTGAAAGARARQLGGSLRVSTTNMREGYLRKNGVPYSQDATMVEYFDRLTYPNGDVIMLVRTQIDDPKYLQQQYLTSPHFKKEANDSKFKPSPCRIDPPTEKGK